MITTQIYYFIRVIEQHSSDNIAFHNLCWIFNEELSHYPDYFNYGIVPLLSNLQDDKLIVTNLNCI